MSKKNLTRSSADHGDDFSRHDEPIVGDVVSMKKVSALVAVVLLAACAKPAPPPNAPRVVEVARPPVAAPMPPAPPPDAAPRIVATNILQTFVLGSTLFVALLEDGPTVRVARVDDDGGLEDVAKGVPRSERVTSRGGELVISGTPTALLGDPKRSIWMAWTGYSVFGSATVYRAVVPGGWTCVGRCAKKPDLEPWSTWLETPMPPSGDRQPSGDLVARRSRGHLFKIANRVSGEGPFYRLPSRIGSPRDTVSRIEPLDDATEARELVDGTIVLVKEQTRVTSKLVILAPEKARAERDLAVDASRAFDGRNADDLWFVEEHTLAHARGAAIARVDLPFSNALDVCASEDGGAWLAGESFAYRYDGATWRKVRFSAEKKYGTVVMATARFVYVEVDGTLVRVDL